ncbi:MAG: phosphatidate cytidylyltransferase [Elusimicrobia bacterium]|nr:phosphatidate cytidylyltransferase [Elusimicrobiota bacterium]
MMALPRLLTALVAAPVFLWVLYLGSLPFLAFALFIILLAFWEFHQMAEAGGFATQSWWSLAAGMFLALSVAFPGIRSAALFTTQAPALALVITVLVLVLREMVRRDKSLSMLRLATSFLGIFFIVWPLSYLILLRELRGSGSPAGYHIGRDAVFFLVLIVWVQDTAAWAAGSFFGKHRLALQISPKKSWEGAILGWLAAVLLALFLREIWLKVHFSRVEIVVLAGALAILAQVSDLAESLMKRGFGVKDSSQLLPGHGGVLDRFDSFLFSTPFLYFYLILLGYGG